MSFLALTKTQRWFLFCSGILLLSGTPGAEGHGFVGDRFFPPTIATDDPFATDELLLPAVSYFKNPAGEGSPATATTDVNFEFDKEIFPRFALGIAGDLLVQRPGVGRSVSGLDNVTLSSKFQLWQSDAHEAIFSVGGEWEIGGSGSQRVGGDSASTFSPAIYFGKGFGDLPHTWEYARPFAFTGTVAEDLPNSAAPDSLEWGGALEYSLPYLQQQVKDIGLPAPLKNIIPLVEFSLESPENRHGGKTTGTINPGLLYEARYFQLGAEAIVPVNRSTGREVGVILQVEVFLDDIWPKVFGRPVFEHHP